MVDRSDVSIQHHRESPPIRVLMRERRVAAGWGGPATYPAGRRSQSGVPTAYTSSWYTRAMRLEIADPANRSLITLRPGHPVSETTCLLRLHLTPTPNPIAKSAFMRWPSGGWSKRPHWVLFSLVASVSGATHSRSRLGCTDSTS